MRWFIRRLPETDFDLSFKAFMASGPQIQVWINEAKSGALFGRQVKEDEMKLILKRCYLQYYREFYTSETKFPLKGGKDHPQFGRVAFRKAISWEVPKRGLLDTGPDATKRAKIIGNPAMRSAINRGRRLLRKSAKNYYNYIRSNAEPELKKIEKSIDDAKKKVDESRKKYEDTMKEAHKFANDMRNKRGTSLIDALPTGEGMDKMMGQILGTLGGANKAESDTAKVLLADVDYAYKDWQEARKEYGELSGKIEEKIKEFDPRNFYNILFEKLHKESEDAAKKESTGLGQKLSNALGSGGGTEYWRYKDIASDLILKELETEADYLARYYGRRIQTRFMRYAPKMALGMRAVSQSAQTGGEAWTLMLHNIWNFVFGPWIIGTIFVLIQFFFVLAYVGYNVQILWIMPVIAAAITFILNFADSTRPFDWITHLASGAMIGYSCALLLIVLGAHNWTGIGITGTNSLGFWIAWLILGFIALFQLYQTGGFKVILQGSIIILLLAYLALGPYQAYFQQTVDQVRAPVEIAYRAVSNAVTDIWLLATDPTEWYARQQLVNVRPEKPLDYPKGIEITSLEALPPSVAAGQNFVLTAIVKNDGPIDAKDVVVSLGCNQWCKSSAASPTEHEPYSSANELDQATLQSLNSGKSFYVNDRLSRGEAQVITIQNLGSNVFTQSVAQTNLARIYFNLSYAYSTNASLQVSVISNDELNRRFREGETVFRQVVAVDKGTPARLSLNVGPQPLKESTDSDSEDTKSLLLVSISNTRDESKVVLPRGTPVIIKLPLSIGHDLNCGSKSESKLITDDYEAVTYKIDPTDSGQNAVEVLPYEFRSIFAFICSFKTNKGIQTTKTGIITAELPRYIFRLEQKKDIPVTPPLGIIFDPFDQVCAKCGEGLTNICDKTECHKLSAGEDKCWFDGYGLTGTVSRIGKDVCHSCGPASTRGCDMFTKPDACTDEDDNCDLNCVWVEGGTNPANGVAIEGTCVSATSGITVTAGSVQEQIARKIYEAAVSMKPVGADAQVKAEGVADSFEEMILKLAWHENRFRHCTDGTLNCVNDNTYQSVICSLPVSDSRSSCGVAQIAINKHKDEPGGDWRTSTTDYQCSGKAAYDADCNIRLGIGLLIKYYNDYGQNGNSEPACTTEPYASKYRAYRGWKAALRAYNGWGCAENYPGGQAAAGDFVENVIATDVFTIANTINQQQQQESNQWKIGGQTGLVEIGEVEGDRFFAQITNIQNNKFTIALKVLAGSTYDDVDCRGGLMSGYEATLAEGEEAECDTRGTLNPIAIVSGDDINLKLVGVDYTNKNILLSVGSEPFYGPGRNPLPDWRLCANNICADEGRVIQYKLPVDIDTRIALSSVDTANNEATFIAYTKEGFMGWFETDCSDWPLKNAVTMTVGETEGCVSSDLMQFTENFAIRLDSIDSTTKTVRISLPKLG